MAKARCSFKQQAFISFSVFFYKPDTDTELWPNKTFMRRLANTLSAIFSASYNMNKSLFTEQLD